MDAVTAEYWRTADGSRLIGGRFSVHGALQDINNADSRHSPVCSVTHWGTAFPSIEELNGVAVIVEVESVLEGTVEPSVDDFGLGLEVGPVVLLGIVSSPVLDWSADISKTPAIVVLVVLSLDSIPLVLEEKVRAEGGPLGLPESKAVKLRLSLIEMLDGWREESDVVASDGVTVKLAESMSLVPDPVVLEFLAVVDDIELEMLCAEVKLAACVSWGEAVVDRTAELLPLRVFVPVILTFRESLEKLDVAAVWSVFPVSCKDSLETIAEVSMVAEIEDAEGIEEIGIWVPATELLEPEEGVATMVVFWPLLDGSLIRDEEEVLFPGLVPTLVVLLIGRAPVCDVSPEPLWVKSLEVVLLSLTPVAFCIFEEWVSWLPSVDSGSVRLWLLLLAEPTLELLPAVLSGSDEPDIPEVGLVSPVPMALCPGGGTSFCAILLPSSRSEFSSSIEANGSLDADLAAIGSESVVADSKTLTPCCSLTVILVVVMCVLTIVVESVLATRRQIKSRELQSKVESR
jgi:hypothetical protein